MRTGAWDATTVFPYGGVFIRGMIRRDDPSVSAPVLQPREPKKVVVHPQPQQTYAPGRGPLILRQEGNRHCEAGVGGVYICRPWTPKELRHKQ